MNTKTAYAVSWALTALALLAGFYFYPHLPATMVSHWNVSGEPNGYLPTLWGITVVPITMAALIGIFALIPRIDPMHANIALFRRHYNALVVIIIFALAVIQGALLAFNLGKRFDIAGVVIPTVGVLFFAIGMILPETKRNWFVGIRTPWTLQSDHVWEQTHKVGGRVFEIIGVTSIISSFFPQEYAAYIFFAPLITGVVGVIAYSYVVFREDERAQGFSMRR